jgi:hypothetical protein
MMPNVRVKTTDCVPVSWGNGEHEMDNVVPHDRDPVRMGQELDPTLMEYCPMVQSGEDSVVGVVTHPLTVNVSPGYPLLADVTESDNVVIAGVMTT